MIFHSYVEINIFNDKTYTMKKLGIYSILLAMGSITFMGCSSSKKSAKGGILSGDGSITSTAVKTVATIVGVILLSKLIKSVLNTVGGSSVFGAAKKQGFLANFNEDTKLNSFANNDLMKTALQVVVAEQYKIPLTTVTKNFNSLVTAGDLATFIGKNADAKVLMGIK